MPNYRSRTRVFQRWGAPEAGTAGDQNVFVFGPRYDLHRYDVASEKALLKKTEYTIKSTDFHITNAFDVSSNYEVDKEGVKAVAETAYINLYSGTDGFSCGASSAIVSVPSGSDQYSGTLKFTGKKLAGDGKDAALARDVVAGDYVVVKTDASTTVVCGRITSVTVSGSDTTVTLSDGLPDSVWDSENSRMATLSNAVYVCAKSNDVVVPSTVDASGDVVVTAGAQVDYAGQSRSVVKATLFVEYRALYTGTSAGIQVATSEFDVEKALGPAVEENPLSLCVLNAFVGGAPVVYYYITSGDSRADFSAALERAETMKDLYYIVPASQDPGVITDTVDHVDRMSTENTKRWRIAVVCNDVPTTSETSFDITGTGTYNTGTKTYVTLKASGGVPDAVDGDVVYVGDAQVYTITRKLNSTTLLTSTEAAGQTTEAWDGAGEYDDGVSAMDSDSVGKLEHRLTPSEYAAAIAGAASSLGTFRAVDVAPKTFEFDGETYSSMFLAPIVAGMKAAEEPQAPITDDTVPGVDAVPDTYSLFTERDLDTMAAGGVFIVAQDMANERVYVRKQLTTGTIDGILAQTELSMLVNFDSVTKYFSNMLDSYKGSCNVTQPLLDKVTVDLLNGIYVKQNNQTNALVGPQLLDGSRVVSVSIDKVNKGKINAHVFCDLPTPFDSMDLYLSVDTSDSSNQEQIQ